MIIAYVQSPEFVVGDDPHVTPKTSNFLSKVPRDVIVAHYSGPMAGNANINGLSWFGVFVGNIDICNMNIPGIFCLVGACLCYQALVNLLPEPYKAITGKAFSKCICFSILSKFGSVGNEVLQ